jgi:hypothetical protein
LGRSWLRASLELWIEYPVLGSAPHSSSFYVEVVTQVVEFDIDHEALGQIFTGLPRYLLSRTDFRDGFGIVMVGCLWFIHRLFCFRRGS